MNIYLFIMTLLLSNHTFGSYHEAKRPAPDSTENSLDLLFDQIAGEEGTNNDDFSNNITNLLNFESTFLEIPAAAAAAPLSGVNWNPDLSTNPEDFSCIFCTSTSGCDCANQLEDFEQPMNPGNSLGITIENLISRENEAEEEIEEEEPVASESHQCLWGKCNKPQRLKSRGFD